MVIRFLTVCWGASLDVFDPEMPDRVLDKMMVGEEAGRTLWYVEPLVDTRTMSRTFSASR